MDLLTLPAYISLPSFYLYCPEYAVRLTGCENFTHSKGYISAHRNCGFHAP
nr:MAG TPA: hypothetical protein [Caudoviricetes sp.]DAU19047.1 MAG TPA: hypothetical protein [Caudoviricetes sp.]